MIEKTDWYAALFGKLGEANTPAASWYSDWAENVSDLDRDGPFPSERLANVFVQELLDRTGGDCSGWVRFNALSSYDAQVAALVSERTLSVWVEGLVDAQLVAKEEPDEAAGLGCEFPKEVPKFYPDHRLSAGDAEKLVTALVARYDEVGVPKRDQLAQMVWVVLESDCGVDRELAVSWLSCGVGEDTMAMSFPRHDRWDWKLGEMAPFSLEELTCLAGSSVPGVGWVTLLRNVPLGLFDEHAERLLTSARDVADGNPELMKLWDLVVDSYVRHGLLEVLEGGVLEVSDDRVLWDRYRVCLLAGGQELSWCSCQVGSRRSRLGADLDFAAPNRRWLRWLRDRWVPSGEVSAQLVGVLFDGYDMLDGGSVPLDSEDRWFSDYVTGLCVLVTGSVPDWFTLWAERMAAELRSEAEHQSYDPEPVDGYAEGWLRFVRGAVGDGFVLPAEQMMRVLGAWFMATGYPSEVFLWLRSFYPELLANPERTVAAAEACPDLPWSDLAPTLTTS